MADLGISGLKTEVDVKIYTNHSQAITGAIMNDTLIDTIDTLKNGGNLDAKSVDTAQLADGAVEALQINTDAVETAKIKDLAVTVDKIATGAVTEEKIGASAVINTKIATGAVTEEKIADSAVANTKIASGAVTAEKIATGAVTHAKIGVDAIDDSNIQDGSITESKIYEGSINEGHLQMNCVTEEKIVSGAVIEEKIGASAVTSTKIATGAVTEAKIGSGAVTEAKIGAKAVTNTKIGDKAVDTLQLADGAVKALQIGSGAVETAKIKDLNVTTSKLAAKAVTSEKLADDAIVRTFAGAVLLNPYSASLTPRRVGDIAINTTTGEIWQSTSIVNAVGAWNRISAGFYNGSQITDWNAIRLSGDLTSSGDATGAPTTAESFYGHHINSHAGTADAYQIAIGFTTGKIYHRSKLDSTWGAWELQASASYVESIKENVDSINVDNLGDVRAKSIDMDELPKVCSFPMYIISTTAPNVVPDFVSQHWIDTVAKKVYIAVGVSSSADFVALN